VGLPLAPMNEYLTYRDSFYWDRNAYVVAGCTVAGGPAIGEISRPSRCLPFAG
jgi:hypothetical protein